jgi:hypothetical protein
MLKRVFIAAAVLVAGVNTVSAEDLHCQFGSLSLDRTDKEMRACDAGDCYVVIDGKLRDGTRIQIGPRDHTLRLNKYVVTCADRARIRSTNDPTVVSCFASILNEPGATLYINVNVAEDDRLRSISADISEDNGAKGPNGHVPTDINGEVPDSRKMIVKLADGYFLVRDGADTMLLTPRGRTSCSASGDTHQYQTGAFSMTDEQIAAAGERNAEANRQAAVRVSGMVCRFADGTVIDSGTVFRRGKVNQQVVIAAGDDAIVFRAAIFRGTIGYRSGFARGRESFDGPDIEGSCQGS